MSDGTDLLEDITVKPGLLEGEVEVPGPKAELARYVPDVLAYAERYSVTAGQEVELKVSSPKETLQAEIVRLKAPLTGRRPDEAWESYADLGQLTDLVHEPLSPGSYLLVEESDAFDLSQGAAFAGWIRPTLIGLPNPQTVFALVDADRRPVLQLSITRAGALTCTLSDPSIDYVASVDDILLESHRWYRIAVGWSPSRGTLDLYCSTLDEASVHHAFIEVPSLEAPARASILFGAAPWRDSPALTDQHLNGKLAHLRWYAELDQDTLEALASPARDLSVDASPLVSWDLGAECETTTVKDAGPLGVRTATVNQPQRGVIGPMWDGGPGTSFEDGVDDYDAIKLHDDDVGDVSWPTTLTWEVPAGTPSGTYAVRLSAPLLERFVPFVVCPSAEGRTAQPPVLVILPWFTYLLYGNDQICRRGWGNREEAFANDDARRFLREYPSLGYSAYDRHRDGSGIAYSSARRPLINLTPGYFEASMGAPRGFPVDLYLIEFLDRNGVAYDVVTDLELHRQGSELLERYPCVVTGGHPEYVTGGMLDALDSYVAGGGNIVYLGGNGLHHPVSVSADGSVVERRYGGSPLVWQSAPGEYHHSLDGQLAAEWALLDRSSQRLLGVCTAGEGTGGAGQGYKRAPDLPSEAGFVFAGVTADVVGGHGAARGGAAGDEVDAIVDGQPTPDRTVLLARAEGFDDYYVGIRDPIQADMVLAFKDGGGRVFSVGSMQWVTALADNMFRNDVARVTMNVIEEFSAAG
jgi:N,N-dimethylformamidase